MLCKKFRVLSLNNLLSCAQFKKKKKKKKKTSLVLQICSHMNQKLVEILSRSRFNLAKKRGAVFRKQS